MNDQQTKKEFEKALTDIGKQIVTISSKKQSSLFIALVVDICSNVSQCKKLCNNYIKYQVDKKLLKLPKNHVFNIKNVQLIAIMLNRTIIISKYDTKKKCVLLLCKLNQMTEEDVPLCVSHLVLLL
jgi:hypothetical protein